eukprot:750241-Hanusia_phi.AAC.2
MLSWKSLEGSLCEESSSGPGLSDIATWGTRSWGEITRRSSSILRLSGLRVSSFSIDLDAELPSKFTYQLPDVSAPTHVRAPSKLLLLVKAPSDMLKCPCGETVRTLGCLRAM